MFNALYSTVFRKLIFLMIVYFFSNTNSLFFSFSLACLALSELFAFRIRS